MTHSEWVQKEYQQWIAALQECTVDNFKEHPMVKRMLSEVDYDYWMGVCESVSMKQAVKLAIIDSMGASFAPRNGTLWRFIYYAQQILKLNPESIVEIGGGVGQFYAVLRALGYTGRYWIADLFEVKKFQNAYLLEVAKRTGLETIQIAQQPYEMVVSFHAFGEFDDKTKESYLPLLKDCKRGYIAWNAHSGATDDPYIIPHQITVSPSLQEGVKIVTW